jgi:hypothetical protein
MITPVEVLCEGGRELGQAIQRIAEAEAAASTEGSSASRRLRFEAKIRTTPASATPARTSRAPTIGSNLDGAPTTARQTLRAFEVAEEEEAAALRKSGF